MDNLTVAISVLVFVCSLPAKADSWNMEGTKSEEYIFGDTRIEKIVEGRGRGLPLPILKIYHRGKLMALYKGVSFEHIYPGKYNGFFYGFSNTGITRSALIGFTFEGEITALIFHGDPRIEYCDKSSTLVRKWFDDSATPSFRYSDGATENNFALLDVSFSDCKGNVNSVNKIVLN